MHKNMKCLAPRPPHSTNNICTVMMRFLLLVVVLVASTPNASSTTTHVVAATSSSSSGSTGSQSQNHNDGRRLLRGRGGNRGLRFGDFVDVEEREFDCQGACQNGGTCVKDESPDAEIGAGVCECSAEVYVGDFCEIRTASDVVLLEEDFDDGTLGEFCIPPEFSGLVEVTSDRVHESSSHSTRIRGDASIYSTAIPLFGDHNNYSTIRVTFAYMPRGMEIGESFTVDGHVKETLDLSGSPPEDVECSVNEDIPFATQKQWTRGSSGGGESWDSNGVWYEDSVMFTVDELKSQLNLASGTNANWLRIRFNVNSNTFHDKVFFDSIVVTAW